MQEEKLRKLRAKLCENLRKARLAAGYSQIEAAALLGKPQSFISKCELGERKILPEELFIELSHLPTPQTPFQPL